LMEKKLVSQLSQKNNYYQLCLKTEL